MAVLDSVFGGYTLRNRNRILDIVSKVNSLKSVCERITTDQTKRKFSIEPQHILKEMTLEEKAFLDKTNEFRRRLYNGESINDILPEALAVVREAIKRRLGMFPYDTQIEASSAMIDGCIAEMKTGEGKTLVQILTSYLYALKSTCSPNMEDWTSVHIMTSNDALAKRDATNNKSVFDLLGLTSSFVTRKDEIVKSSDRKQELARREIFKHKKRQAYQCDIVYATPKTIAFDYLDDNTVLDPKDKLITKKFGYAVIDEADDILFDQANTPLILSTSIDEENTDEKQLLDFYKWSTELLYGKEGRRELKGTIVKTRKKNENISFNTDYCFVEDSNEVFLSSKLEEALFKDYDNSSDRKKELYNLRYLALLDCIVAKHSFIRGKQYELISSSKEGYKRIGLIDSNIGRIKASNKYVGNIQYAIEAKEDYFENREGGEKRFRIETTKQNKTKAKIIYPDFLKLYNEVSGMTGTSDIEEFLELYNLSTYEVPTRKPVIREDLEDELYTSKAKKYLAILKELKECIKTGQPVLIGTTSVLESEEISQILSLNRISHNLLNANNEEMENEIISHAGEKGMITVATNMAGRGTDIKLGPGVKELGGLYVIGVSKNKSERIDRQLKGRSGRQGDPGKSKHFISLDDEIVKEYYGNSLSGLKKTFASLTGRITNTRLLKSINKAQSIIDSRSKLNRRIESKYNEIYKTQRDIIYNIRENLLNSNPKEFISLLKNKIIPEYSSILEKDDIDSSLIVANHLINVKDCYNSDNIGESIKDSFNKRMYDTMKDNNIVGAAIIPYFNKVKKNMLRSLDDFWSSHMERLEELKTESNIALVSDDTIKLYSEKATYEFSNILIPGILNEWLTYAICPNLNYGEYEIPMNMEESENIIKRLNFNSDETKKI